ncbi:hypothetical protein BJ165DRAFT_218530 [Panaeolus papilionaceus]|nr:hypothetical protein BJ165DRAFT_218530 [Panaeolus papilionaceus]
MHSSNHTPLSVAVSWTNIVISLILLCLLKYRSLSSDLHKVSSQLHSSPHPSGAVLIMSGRFKPISTCLRSASWSVGDLLLEFDGVMSIRNVRFSTWSPHCFLPFSRYYHSRAVHGGRTLNAAINPLFPS